MCFFFKISHERWRPLRHRWRGKPSSMKPFFMSGLVEAVGDDPMNYFSFSAQRATTLAMIPWACKPTGVSGSDSRHAAISPVESWMILCL